MDQKPEARVVVSPDAACAQVVIPPGIEQLSAELLAEAARQAGVIVTPEIMERLTAAAAQYGGGGSEVSAVISEAVAAADGDDGRVEWAPGFDPAAGADDPRTDEQTRNYYEVSHWVQVNAGDVVGRLVQPTPGRDGQDALGAPVKARPGRPAAVTPDKSLTVQPDGSLMANEAGVLQLIAGKLSVSQMLNIAGSVDFETGHVNFTGAVRIAGSVRDRFHVTTTGDLSVGEVIEAAVISCGGNLSCPRGMAARDRGELFVAGNADVGYLNNVRGMVRGNLRAASEVLHCELAIGGGLDCERGAVIGGAIAVTQAAKIGSLGSAAGVPTSLVVGTAPLIWAASQKAAREIHRMADQLRELGERADRLKFEVSVGMKERREALDRCVQEMMVLRARITVLRRRRADLLDQARANRAVNVSIAKALHPKVRLRTEGFEIVITRTVPGPLVIRRHGGRSLEIRDGAGNVRPLSEIASLRRAA